MSRERNLWRTSRFVAYPGGFLDLHLDGPDEFIHVVELPRDFVGGGPGLGLQLRHLVVSVG